MAYDQAEKAVKALRAIANTIEADPGCLDGFSVKNSILDEDQSKVHRFLAQEFTVRLSHYVFTPPEKPA